MWSFDTDPDVQRRMAWASSFVADDVVQLDVLHGHPADRRSPETVELFVALREQTRRAGLWGPDLPVEEGGSALGFVERVLLDEAIGASRWAPTVFGYVPHRADYARIIDRYAGAADRESLVPRLRAADAVVAYALNEPYVGGTKEHLRTEAVRSDGGWLLRGEKWFIEDAEFAEVVLVVARTHPGAPAKQAFTLFLVPADAPGVELVGTCPIGGQDPTRSSYGHLAFHDVRLPDSAVMGEPGGAYTTIQSCRSPMELHYQGRALAVMRRCLDLMTEHALTHETKRGPLAEFASTRTVIGQCLHDVEQTRLTVLRAAWVADRDGADAALGHLLAVKAALPTVLGRVVRRAAHLHGVLGMSADMPFAAWAAWADALAVAEGATESYWEDLGRLVLEGGSPRPRYTWPQEHAPSAATILRESRDAVLEWEGEYPADAD